MLITILRLPGLVCLAAAMSLWVYSLAEYDGDCGMDCGDCLFPADCPVRKMREKDVYDGIESSNRADRKSEE